MAMAPASQEPLSPAAAKRYLRAILETGALSFSGHALTEIEKDGLTTVDCVNVLRAGVVELPEFERGSWRYRVRTARITVIVAFRSETSAVVVTAWRIRR